MAVRDEASLLTRGTEGLRRVLPHGRATAVVYCVAMFMNIMDMYRVV